MKNDSLVGINKLQNGRILRKYMQADASLPEKKVPKSFKSFSTTLVQIRSKPVKPWNGESRTDSNKSKSEIDALLL